MQVEYNKLIQQYKSVSKISTRSGLTDLNRLVSLRHSIEEIEESGDVVIRMDSPSQILPENEINDCPASTPCECCRVVHYN